MYEERKDKFSVRDLILQILFILLFVFLLMWLFPTRGDVDKLSKQCGSGKDSKECPVVSNKDENTVLYDRIFNENVLAMKDAAKSYYTNERLPQTVGSKSSMTLKEMLSKKIILPFTDKNGDACSEEDSFVEITKASDAEFVLKVNLKCGEEENYLLVYMGCYDYCTTAVCEKNPADIKTPVINKAPPKPSNNTNNNNVQNIINNITNIIINNGCPECNPSPSPTPTDPPVSPSPTPTDPPVSPSPTPTDKPEKICEYVKIENGSFTEWSGWSDWTTDAQYANVLKQVKTRTVTTTTTKKVLVGYNVTKVKDPNKPIYKTVQVQTGTTNKQVCSSYKDVTVTSPGSYGSWVDQGLVKLYSIPSNTETTKYVFVSRGVDTCENCSYREYSVYKKYTRSYNPGSTTTRKECTGYKTVSTPVYETKKVLTGYETVEKKEPIYKNVKQNSDVKQYSYRTRNVIKGKKTLKWDVCTNSPLEKQGFSKTGNTKNK